MLCGIAYLAINVLSDRGLKLNEQEKGEEDLADPDRQFPGKKVVSSQSHKTSLDSGSQWILLSCVSGIIAEANKSL